MAHPNARLTPLTRWELVQTVRVDGYPVAEAARRFNVSRATAHKCLQRYDAGGRAGLEDGKSRPRSSPVQTSSAIAERIAALRKETGLGPHRIAEEMGVSPSTTYTVLRREGLNRLDHLHRVTREIVRYEHAHPGDLLHLDVKKLGRIPPGGGKRFLPEHAATYAETNSAPKSHKRLGYDHVHVAVDDHSRYAYAEALADDRSQTTVRFLERALAHFASLGVQVTRILTDNGGNYRSTVFGTAVAAHGIRHKRTRPFRPQTNGKAEAFNKTLQAEWAYARVYISNEERLATLPQFLDRYNNHRTHSGIGRVPPASRL